VITNIGVGNFKAFSTLQVIPIRPLTLVFGPNGGGKSSLIQALLFAKQSIEAGSVRVRGPQVDLGSFKSLAHRHDVSKPVQILVAFKPQRSLDEQHERFAEGAPPQLLPDEAIRLVQLVFREQQARARRASHPHLASVSFGLPSPDYALLFALDRRPPPKSGDWIDATGFAMRSAKDARALARWLLGLRSHPTVGDLKAMDERELARVLRKIDIHANPGNLIPTRMADPWTAFRMLAALPTSEMGDVKPPTVPEDLNWSVLSTLSSDFARELASTSYIGPYRAKGERHHVPSDPNPTTVGTAGEHSIAFLRRVAMPKAGQDRLDAWFRRLGIPYQVRVRLVSDDVVGEFLRTTLIDRRTGVRVSPADVGFGVGQLFPILIQSFDSARTVLVEQPELHLHPRLQAELADLFITTAGLDAREPQYEVDGPNQWIIETHSEALMLRVQRRIREGHLLAEHVCVLYIEPGKAGSRILELRLDDKGEFIDEWPGGFFEERFQEMFQ
jgi:hypothetical protein